MILKKAWLFCWLAIPFLLLLPTIDIQQHNTYYVNEFAPVVVTEFAPVVLLFGSVVLFVEGCIYWLFRNRSLKKWLTAFHLSITISFFVFCTIVTMYMDATTPVYPNHYYSFENVPAKNTTLWYQEESFDTVFIIFLILFLLGQLAFIVNLILSRKEQ